MVLFSAAAAATYWPSSAEAGPIVSSMPDGSRSLLYSQKPAPVFFIMSDKEDGDYNDSNTGDKSNKICAVPLLST